MRTLSLLTVGAAVFLAACSSDSLTGVRSDTPAQASLRPVAASASAAPRTAAAVTPSISSVGGYSDYSGGVVNGRWTGQPSRAPAYASNRFKGGLVADNYPYTSASLNPYTVTLQGTGFGTVQGAGYVAVTHRPVGPSPFRATVVSWSNTAIRIRLTGPYSVAGDGVRITVVTASGQSAAIDDRITGLIYSRGAGQCTWEVAYQRLVAGKPIPPSAYPSANAITSAYAPQQYDVLFINKSHTAIITSPVTAIVARDGTITFAFTITERNADWQENRAVSPASFVVKSGRLIQSIRTAAGTFTHYWR